MANRSSQTKEKSSLWRTPYHSPKLLLWLGIGSSAFIFIVLFTLYFLHQQTAEATTLKLPIVFWISTFLLSCSAITFFLGCINFQKEQFKEYRRYIGITLALGLTFVSMQIDGAIQLFTAENQVSENYRLLKFIYLTTGLHLVHVLVSVVFLCMIFIDSLRNHTYVDAYVYSVNPPNRFKIRVLELFWYFICAAWLLIFVCYHLLSP